MPKYKGKQTRGRPRKYFDPVGRDCELCGAELNYNAGFAWYPKIGEVCPNCDLKAQKMYNEQQRAKEMNRRRTKFEKR